MAGWVFPWLSTVRSASQDVLGFNYEAPNLYTNDPDATSCVILSDHETFATRLARNCQPFTVSTLYREAARAAT
jgi:hypothetical protein